MARSSSRASSTICGDRQGVSNSKSTVLQGSCDSKRGTRHGAHGLRHSRWGPRRMGCSKTHLARQAASAGVPARPQAGSCGSQLPHGNRTHSVSVRGLHGGAKGQGGPAPARRSAACRRPSESRTRPSPGRRTMLPSRFWRRGPHRRARHAASAGGWMSCGRHEGRGRLWKRTRALTTRTDLRGSQGSDPRV